MPFHGSICARLSGALCPACALRTGLMLKLSAWQDVESMFHMHEVQHACGCPCQSLSRVEEVLPGVSCMTRPIAVQLVGGATSCAWRHHTTHTAGDCAGLPGGGSLVTSAKSVTFGCRCCQSSGLLQKACYEPQPVAIS